MFSAKVGNALSPNDLDIARGAQWAGSAANIGQAAQLGGLVGLRPGSRGHLVRVRGVRGNSLSTAIRAPMSRNLDIPLPSSAVGDRSCELWRG
jgi:hypothetical protein